MQHVEIKVDNQMIQYKTMMADEGLEDQGASYVDRIILNNHLGLLYKIHRN